MSKRKQDVIIRAWLDGKNIEWQHPTGLYWSELDEDGYDPENPMTYSHLMWRIKVEDEKSKSAVGDKDHWINRMDEDE